MEELILCLVFATTDDLVLSMKCRINKYLLDEVSSIMKSKSMSVNRLNNMYVLFHYWKEYIRSLRKKVVQNSWKRKLKNMEDPIIVF